MMERSFQCDIRKQVLHVSDRCFDTTSLPELLELKNQAPEGIYRDLYTFLYAWFSEGENMKVQTSGSTGVPKVMEVSKRAMMNSACRTCRFLGLQEGDSLLLSMNLKYIGAQMMVVRALVGGLRVLLQEPCAHPLAAVQERIDFLSMVPMQLASSLQREAEKNVLQAAKVVIVGGGAVDSLLEEQLQALPCRVYSTYGMTETLSHIAMRPLNGQERSDRYYPLPGVTLSLSARDTLVIEVPDVCAGQLETNDCVTLNPDGSFVVRGRVDNVINSGGVKIQIEEDERLLQGFLSFPFAITAVPDSFYGEKVILLAEYSELSEKEKNELLVMCKNALPRYHAPRDIIFIPSLPRTENGKIDRKGCRNAALRGLEIKKGG